MTSPGPDISPYDTYLQAGSCSDEDEKDRLSQNLLGPRKGQDLFGLITALAACRSTTELLTLYAGTTPLHQAIDNVPEFRCREGFPEGFGAPFRPGETAGVHALRALAALGLTLAADEPDQDWLHAALAWHRQACATPPGIFPRWSPAMIAGGDQRLRARLELLAGVAGPEQHTAPALAAAVTLLSLAHPSAQPSTEIMFSHPGPPPGAGTHREPARRSSAARARSRLRAWADRQRPRGLTVLFDQGQAGSKAVLTVTVLRGLPPALIPDPERMAMLAADPAFQRALGIAWQQAGWKAGGTVLWAAETPTGPLRYAIGESAGAAFAVVLDEARRLRRPAALIAVRRLVTSNAVIGRIDALGYMQGVGGYDAKLSALGEAGKVIIPATDHEKAREAAQKAGRDLGDIIPAVRWRDAARKARHRTTAVLVRNALVLVLVTATVLAGVLGESDRSASQDAARQSAAALSGKLAALALANLGTHLDTAELLAVEATRIDNTPQARAALFQAVTASPQVQRYLPAGGRVTALAASADGNVVVAGTAAGHLVRFDLATGARTEVAAGPGSISDIAVSADGGTVAAADGPDAVVWKAGTGKAVALAGTGRAALSVAASPSGQLVAVTSSTASPGNYSVALRNVTTGHQEMSAFTSGAAETTTAFSSDTTLILTGDTGSYVELAAAGLHVVAESSRTATPASGYDFGTSPNGVYSGYSVAGNIVTWPTTIVGPGIVTVKSEQQLFRYGDAAPGEPEDMAISPDGKRAATVLNGTIYVSPLATGGIQASPSQLTASANTSLVSFLGGDQRLVSVAGDTLALWDLRQDVQVGGSAGVLIPGLSFAPGTPALSMPADGQWLAVESGAAGTVSLYRFGAALKLAGRWKVAGLPPMFWQGDQLLLAGVPPGSQELQITKPGGHVVAAWPDGGSYPDWVGQLRSGQLVMVTAHGLRYFSPGTGASTFRPVNLRHLSDVLALSPDGQGAAALTENDRIEFTDLRTGAHHVVGSGKAINAVFTGNGLFVELATGTSHVEPAALQEWNASGTRLVRTFPAANYDYPLAVSPDGTVLARITQGGNAAVIDIKTGDTVADFSLPSGQTSAPDPSGLTSMMFTPDQRYLLAATPGAVLSRWDIAEPDLVRIACRRAGSDLTKAEWIQYVNTPPPASLSCLR